MCRNCGMVSLTMKPASSKQLAALLALMLAYAVQRLAADCTVTNLGVAPLNEMGFTTYSNSVGGLYPNGANTRPPAHEAAGMRIATNEVVPLDASGSTDTNNGKIVLLSLGVSNTTQEWASGDNVTHNITNAFKYRADQDPSKNPQLVIVDGAFGGQDAITWTNPASANWAMVITQRLVAVGVTTNQVQALWLKQALVAPHNYGSFSGHAPGLPGYPGILLRIAKAKYPNLKLAYLS